MIILDGDDVVLSGGSYVCSSLWLWFQCKHALQGVLVCLRVARVLDTEDDAALSNRRLLLWCESYEGSCECVEGNGWQMTVVSSREASFAYRRKPKSGELFVLYRYEGDDKLLVAACQSVCCLRDSRVALIFNAEVRMLHEDGVHSAGSLPGVP